MEDSYKRKHPVEGKKIKFKQDSTAMTQKNRFIWPLTITFMSFIIAIILTIASSGVLNEANIITSFVVIFIFILINIIFDIVGTAVTAADEIPFHAMASRKTYGAKQAIKLIRNADKVSNVCNDVVGDICGIISGAAGAYIIVRIVGSTEAITITELLVTGLITAMTVGGKALGKTIALSKSNYIIYKVGVITKFILDKLAFLKGKRKQKNG